MAPPSSDTGHPCTWCGASVGADDGFRLLETGSGRRAVFCRLEHVIPWAIKGARWDEAGGEPGSPEEDAGPCAYCGGEPGADRVELVRHRGEHRIPDPFCGVEHLLAWAKAGGRFG